MAKKDAETPLMKQYNQVKGKYPDALLLFRVGDFYETFGEDAVKASKILGIVLTARNNGNSKIELAGFPHHSLDTYLPKLVRAGQRVAICDQLEDPKLTKKIVKRGVTEVVTPGISFSDKVLEHKTNNFLAAVHFGKKSVGLAMLDVSTGEFFVAEGDSEYIEKLVQGLKPSEIICQKQKFKTYTETFGHNYHSYKLDDWVFTPDYAGETLLGHFATRSLKGFGIDDLENGIVAAGAVLHYLQVSQHTKLKHITAITRIDREKYVWLDRFTIRNLEIVYSLNPDATTLLDVIDFTVTPMGGRLLKRWVVLPLKDVETINRRLEIVTEMMDQSDAAAAIRDRLANMGDMERLISRAAVGKINPKEIIYLRNALTILEPVRQFCLDSGNTALKDLGNGLDLCTDLKTRIEAEIEEEPPVLISKGNTIRAGVNVELDELRAIRRSGKAFLDDIVKRESEKTGIPSLKIAYNNVFGYYLEVRNAHKEKVPEEWIRKQTLTQAERYITEELKEYEQKILGAEEKIVVLESQLFDELVRYLAGFISAIQKNAQIVAQLDCMLGFATCALKNKYTRPVINDTKILDIRGGRHPVIEQKLETGEAYIPNDVLLSPDDTQIMMITGPNMSGKSALLRQTALIVLMGQMGSYVPAGAATFGVVDKIFTRVGASDNISSGESTFMVEMNETASILNNISERSLILLDEIGRGTSTYDGISIAWAIAEYIHQHPTHAKTLFATHYHELNDMTKTFKRIHNYNVSVREVGNKVIFMRKLEQGGSEHSFGIHVARMAGMPGEVVSRANEVLGILEQSHTGNNGAKKGSVKPPEPQLSFFQLDDPVLEQIRDEIRNLDLNNLTPVEALMKLNEIKKLIGVA